MRIQRRITKTKKWMEMKTNEAGLKEICKQRRLKERIRGKEMKLLYKFITTQ